MSKKNVGRPELYKDLMKPKNWNKILKMIANFDTRDYICAEFNVNKDTFLKAIKEKSEEDGANFETFKDLQNIMIAGKRNKIRKKFFEMVESKNSEKLMIYCMEKYILPFEEFNQQENENENIKVMYVPISTYNDQKELAKLAEQQQKEIAEAIKVQQAEMTKNMEDKNV